jgi:L-ascorbate metabolism protein UlaG (beta-lactamase superfamily)
MLAFLKWAGIVTGGLVSVLAAFVIWSDSDRTEIAGRVFGDRTRLVEPKFDGTPVDQKGRYVNLEHPYLPKTVDLLKWIVKPNEFSNEKANDQERIDVADPSEFLQSGRDGILWLGHASFYVRLGGRSILIDPVFGKPPFITEYVALGSPLDELPSVDVVLISHDHRDHMDENTIKSIAAKFPDAVFLAGLGSDEILSEWIGSQKRTVTAGWFEQFAAGGGVRFYFVPVRHWSRRGLFDTNRRLWGGFVIQHGDRTIYFGGDSGYGRHYRELAEIFPKLDYFLIGIGAFEPRWIMEPNHNSPSDAVKAFTDSNAAAVVPMHYGRFDLSDEPPGMPLKIFLDEAKRAGIEDKVRVLPIYGSIDL